MDAPQPDSDRPPLRRTRRALALLLGASGLFHLVAPGVYQGIVPAWAGDPRMVVLTSGVAELAVSGLLGRQRTAVAGGWSAAALLVAVWPANIKMALEGGALAWARVPLQVPLVVAAVAIGRRGGGDRPNARPPAGGPGQRLSSAA